MIRYSPIGLIVAALFLLLGPHDWLNTAERPSHTAPLASPVTPILPDANSLGDQPRRSMVDAVQTKQGWLVRVEHGLPLRYDLIVIPLIIAAGWYVRRQARGEAAPGPLDD